MLKKVNIPDEISENLAYICGILAGDGNIEYDENESRYCIKCVGNPKDEKELYFNVIKPRFDRIFGVEIIPRLHDGETTFGFVLFSKNIVNYLVNTIGLPFGKKYEKLTIPDLFKKDERLIINFIRGLFDTDGCMCFKRRYKKEPYYPVITLALKGDKLVKEVSNYLQGMGFKISERYNYKVKDSRIEQGYTTISRIDLNGKKNLELWNQKIGFFSPKHLAKIEKYYVKKRVAEVGFEFVRPSRMSVSSNGLRVMSPAGTPRWTESTKR